MEQLPPPMIERLPPVRIHEVASESSPSGVPAAKADADGGVGAVEPSDDRRSCKRRKRSSRRLFHSVARRSSSSGSEGRPPVSGIEPLVDGLDTGTKISDPSEKIGSDGLNLIQVTFAIGILAPIVADEVVSGRGRYHRTLPLLELCTGTHFH